MNGTIVFPEYPKRQTGSSGLPVGMCLASCRKFREYVGPDLDSRDGLVGIISPNLCIIIACDLVP